MVAIVVIENLKPNHYLIIALLILWYFPNNHGSFIYERCVFLTLNMHLPEGKK